MSTDAPRTEVHEPTPAELFSGRLRDAARRFAASRRITAAVVQIVLADGEHLIVQAVRPGLLPDWIDLDVYPEDPDAEMLRPAPAGDEEDGGPVTPRVVCVPVRGVFRIELLARAPGRQALGFHA